MELTEGQQVVVEGASEDRERFNGRSGELVELRQRPVRDAEPFALVRLDGLGNTSFGYRVFYAREVKEGLENSGL